MKKLTKKFAALFLAFALIISIMPLNAYISYAETLNSNKLKTDTVTYTNPAYEGLDIKTYSPKPYNSPSLLSETETFDTVEQAGEYLKEQMIARNGTITFTINQTYSSELFKAIFNEAVEDNGYGDSSAGDYLYWNWIGYSGSASYTSTQATLTYNMKYLTTYSQEQAVDKEVKNVLDSLDVYDKDTYQKVLAVHDYIVQNIDYDYSLQNHSAYNAIIDKSVVCQGFATITCKMLKELNIGVRLITGPNHAWNIVKLGSYWYNTDNTWDENTSTSSNISYKYFLKGSTDFIDHTRDSQFDTASFHEQYPTATSAYKYDPSVTITFDPNDGSDYLIEKTISKDEALNYTPTAPTKKGYTFIGWFKDTNDITTEYKSGSKYTENITYKAKYAHVEMLGAQVKAIVDDKSGIRFGTKIYDDGDKIIEKGTLILPANRLAEGESLTLDTPNTARSIAKALYEENKEENYVVYLGTIINIPRAQFATPMTAASYIIYEDKAGNEYTAYAPYKNGSTSVNSLLGI